MMEPGRCEILPSDLVDAQTVLGIAQALHGRPITTGSLRIMRETVWFIWQQPRLPRPLIWSKYPTSYPWSSAARARHESNGRPPAGGLGLILEHVNPMKHMVVHLVERAPSLDGPMVADFLHANLAAAVVTADENRRLARAGVASTFNDGDIWERYRVAGIDVDGFAQLNSRSERH